MSTRDDSPPEGGAPFAPRPYPPRPAAASPLRGHRVLVADADAGRARDTAATLAELGCSVTTARPDELAARLDGGWEVLIAAPNGLDAAALLERRRAGDLPPVVAVASSGGGERLPAELVFSYLPGDGDATALRHAVGHALEQSSLADENRRLRDSLAGRFAFGRFVSRDPAMRAVLATVESVADTRATILLLGESGTGKTMLAQTVHQRSSRAGEPFVVVNCGALPPTLLESELFGHVRGAFSGAVKDRTGRFEQADGGTLFLDEINSASLDLQVKLLRAIQDRTFQRVGDAAERQVDVRLVVASNRDLEAEIAAGRFREDLYYRIDVVSVELPPLRERPGDVPLLVEHFVARYAREYEKPLRRVHPDCLSVLAAQDWPGNVRQLENAVERAVLLSTGHELVPADLGAKLREAARAYGSEGLLEDVELGLERLSRVPPLKDALAGPERRIILRALELCLGNRKEAAEMLQINRSTLFNKMRKYGLMDLSFGPQ